MIRYMGQILVDTKVSRDGSKDWSAFCLLHAMRCDATGVLDATRRDEGSVCTHGFSSVFVRSFVRFLRSVSVRTKDDESSRVESIDVCVKLNRRLLVGRPTEEED